MKTEILNTADLSEKSVEELEALLKQQNQAQFALRLQPMTGEMPKPHLFGVLRKNVARIKTVLNQKGVRR